MEIVRLETEIKSRFYSRMKALYERTITMHHTMKEFSTTLSSLSDPRFLQKALESGQISISEYYVERALFNQSREELIEMHYRHYLDMAELSKYLVN
jgi:hypothetical protein